MSIAITYY